MDERKPDNCSKKDEHTNEEIEGLLRKFLELELSEYVLEQERRELEAEEDMLHEEQYGDDSAVALYDIFFEFENS